MSDTPKTWGEMSNVEKGALLLAHHESPGSVEFYNGSVGWETLVGLGWLSETAYRIKPEPKRETVALAGLLSATVAGLWEFDTMTSPHKEEADYIITFDTIDGEPDCTSIKMERIE